MWWGREVESPLRADGLSLLFSRLRCKRPIPDTGPSRTIHVKPLSVFWIMTVSDMNEMANSVDRESPLKSKQDEILKECDRLINHFSRKAHESKRNFRSFKYVSVILSAIVAILSTLQSIKHWSLLQVIIPAISSITALSTTLLAVTNAQEHWLQSRSTQQKLHIEKLLFLQEAGRYSDLESKERIKTFSEQVMNIWSSGHEQWEKSSKNTK
jgi:hypothetical protein